jgi:CspA family cold shock protein
MVVRSRGIVESFDRHAGLGVLRASDGRLYPFHCAEIADGSRDITVGTEVEFLVVPGHRGTWEARELGPAGASPGPPAETEGQGPTGFTTPPVRDPLAPSAEVAVLGGGEHRKRGADVPGSPSGWGKMAA